MKFFAYLAAWSLYWIGDLACRVLELNDGDRWASFWYPVYNWLMLSSSAVQDRYGLAGPWQKDELRTTTGQQP